MPMPASGGFRRPAAALHTAPAARPRRPRDHGITIGSHTDDAIGHLLSGGRMPQPGYTRGHPGWAADGWRR